ncbi:MAG: hypothetical protein ACI9MR_001218 [Myxococcota bacterium]|jgi:hypothetical protein
MTLYDYLERVRVMLRRFILMRAQWLPAMQDGPSGDALVPFLRGQERRAEPVVGALAELHESLGRVAVVPVDPTEVGARFATLSARFDLDAAERDVLWLLLAPEFDDTFLNAYRMIWGDSQQCFCDRAFLIRTVAPDLCVPVLDALAPTSILRQLMLVHAVQPSLASRTFFRVDRRLLSYLVGKDEPPDALRSRLETFPAAQPASWVGFELGLPAERRDLALALADGGIVTVVAPERAGVETIARQLLAERSIPFIRVDAGPLLADVDKPELLADDGRLLRAILREARLSGAALFMEGVERLSGVEVKLCRMMGELLTKSPGPIILHCVGSAPLELLRWVVSLGSGRHIKIDGPKGDGRKMMWHHLLSETSEEPVDDHLIATLATYPLSPRSMELALVLHGSTGTDVDALCQQLITHRLSELARRVSVDQTWEDVVLSAEVWEGIDEVRALGLNYDRVMEDWGLGTITSGRGMKIMLSGPSGTGKTLISGLLARDMGLELYQVDLSSVVSKYIGETQKHLAKIFDEAEAAGVALLFDEADSLFAKRSATVSSSTDRYANQGVNFLLQRLEQYQGFVILTTNLKEVIDPAFTRRLTFHIEFQRPDEEQRKALWRIHLPASLPLSDDADLDAMGEAYELSGGEIRKTAVRAAARALHRGKDRVGLYELECAARSAYVANGRLPPARLMDDTED